MPRDERADDSEDDRPVLRITFDAVCRNAKSEDAPISAAWAWSAEENIHEIATNSGFMSGDPGVSQITATYAAALSALEYVTGRGASYGNRRRRSEMYAELSSSNKVVVDLLKGRSKATSENVIPWHEKMNAAKSAVTMPVIFNWQDGGVSPRIREICEAVLDGAEKSDRFASADVDEELQFDAGAPTT